MANPFNITIADTSPIFRYYPSQDGPIASSWNASFSGSSDSTWVPQALGVGTSSHRTRLSGASVRLDWFGTAIYLYGESSVGAYTIELDDTTTNVETGTPGLLFFKSGLSYGSHSLTLHVIQSTSTTSISSAIITVRMGEAGTFIQNRTINTLTVPLTTDGIVLSGTWYESRMTYGIGGPFVPRLATDVFGSSISFPISSANAFYIIGHVNFDHGPYIVTFTPPSDLGPARTFEYNGSSHWVGLNTLKFLATGLDRTRTYRVQVTNQANLFYDQSQIVIIDTPPDPSYPTNPSPSSGSNDITRQSLSVGAIAGIAVGLFLFFIFLTFLVLLWRKRRSSQKDVVTQRITLPSNPPMSTTLLPSPPNAQEWVYVPEYPTTELRPLRPDSTISQSEQTLPLSASTPFAIPDVSPQYPIRGDLTQEDARFFNNLYALNVPAADIASMMEALRAEREATANANRTEGFGSSGAIRVEPEDVDVVPPRYDFKDSK